MVCTPRQLFVTKVQLSLTEDSIRPFETKVLRVFLLSVYVGFQCLLSCIHKTNERNKEEILKPFSPAWTHYSRKKKHLARARSSPVNLELEGPGSTVYSSCCPQILLFLHGRRGRRIGQGGTQARLTSLFMAGGAR